MSTSSILFNFLAFRELISTTFVVHAGYNGLAEANDIIILYPQVLLSTSNPEGCWDWYNIKGGGGLAVQIYFLFSLPPPLLNSIIHYCLLPPPPLTHTLTHSHTLTHTTLKKKNCVVTNVCVCLGMWVGRSEIIV